MYGKYAKVDTDRVYNDMMLEMYESAQEEICIFSGELWPFAADLAFTERFINHLLKYPDIILKIVCGDVIACRQDKNGFYNPLLRELELNKLNATVYSNRFSLTEQIDDKYFHSIIVDKWKWVMAETPHDYDAHSNQIKESKIRRLFLNGVKDAASTLMEFYDKYIVFNDLPVVTDFNNDDWKRYHYDKLEGIYGNDIEDNFPSIFSYA
jgi:hypothetical protein